MAHSAAAVMAHSAAAGDLVAAGDSAAAPVGSVATALATEQARSNWAFNQRRQTVT
jgi:hypothetical protein